MAADPMIAAKSAINQARTAARELESINAARQAERFEKVMREAREARAELEGLQSAEEMGFVNRSMSAAEKAIAELQQMRDADLKYQGRGRVRRSARLAARRRH